MNYAKQYADTGLSLVCWDDGLILVGDRCMLIWELVSALSQPEDS